MDLVNLPNHALGGYFNPYIDFFNLRTFFFTFLLPCILVGDPCRLLQTVHHVGMRSSHQTIVVANQNLQLRIIRLGLY